VRLRFFGEFIVHIFCGFFSLCWKLFYGDYILGMVGWSVGMGCFCEFFDTPLLILFWFYLRLVFFSSLAARGMELGGRMI